MRSFSITVLFFLLLGMCGLCAVQWMRETKLRETALALRADFVKVSAERDELNEHAKAADAEMLRVTGALTELRTSSISKADLDAAVEANAKLKEQIMMANQSIMQQNETLKKQNEALQQQATAIQKANDTIKKTAAERDDLAKKSNEITTKYNALLKKQGDGN